MWFDDSKGAAVVTLPVALNCTKYKTINYFGNKRHLNFIRKIYKTLVVKLLRKKGEFSLKFGVYPKILH